MLSGAINGSLRKPEFSGEARITDGRIRHMSLPQSLQGINGSVKFSGDGIAFDNLTAQLAAGKVRVGGRVGMDGYTIGQLGVSVTGENMDLRYPAGFRTQVDAQLDLVGTMAAPMVRGTVTVKNALYNKRLDLIPGLTDLFGGRAAPAGAASATPSLPIRFDVKIQAPSSLRIENNLLHIVASADLALRGTLDRPVLDGRVQVDRGEAILEGKRYLVRRGIIDFINPTKIEPSLDLELETLIRVPGQTYVVNIQVDGTFAGFKPQFTSDPPLSELEIASLLFGSNTANADARDAELRTLQRDATQRDLATSRLQQAALGVLSAPLTRAVEQAFALDTVQITPNLGFDPNQRLNTTAQTDRRQADLGEGLPDVLAQPEHRGRRHAGDPRRVQPERPPVLDRLAERGRHLRPRRPREARLLMRPRVFAIAAALMVLAARPGAAQPAGAQPSWTACLDKPIAAIRLVIDGREVQDAEVARALETVVGHPLTAEHVRQSLVRLMAIARFDDVAAEAEMASSGVVLTYLLTPAHPIKVIRFRGDLGLPEKQLRAAVTERYTASPPLSRVREIADLLESDLSRPRLPEGDGAARDRGDPQSGSDHADVRHGRRLAGAGAERRDRGRAGGKRRPRPFEAAHPARRPLRSRGAGRGGGAVSGRTARGRRSSRPGPRPT